MESDNFAIVVPVEYELHAPETPFCYDESCPCHEDEVLIFEVSLHVQDGLMTPDEATEFVKGKGLSVAFLLVPAALKTIQVLKTSPTLTIRSERLLLRGDM